MPLLVAKLKAVSKFVDVDNGHRMQILLMYDGNVIR